MVDRLSGRLRGLIASPACLLCAGAASDLICFGCEAALPWNRIACPRCAVPLSAAAPHLCVDCAAEPPPFESAVGAFRYERPVAAAIQNLKYNADFLAARWLGRAMADAVIAKGNPMPQVLLPVPLHAARLRSRGFNQALELARVSARQLRLHLEPDWARRSQATRDQIGLSAAQRQRNVKGAFEINARISGLRVALLDDVMTTGSTLAELARACLKSGAAGVEVWAVARAE